MEVKANITFPKKHILLHNIDTYTNLDIYSAGERVNKN